MIAEQADDFQRRSVSWPKERPQINFVFVPSTLPCPDGGVGAEEVLVGLLLRQRLGCKDALASTFSTIGQLARNGLAYGPIFSIGIG